jgi:phosphate:Na+ symporter
VLRELLDLDGAPAAFLALFHTVFNLLGVALMWPLANRLSDFLQHRFRTAEEDEARPHHLDANLLGVPALAMDALLQETRRMGVISLRMLREAAGGAGQDRLAGDRQIVSALNYAIADFVMQLSRTTMSVSSAQRLPDILRIARYYETLSELALDMAGVRRELTTMPPPEAAKFGAQAEALLDSVDPSSVLRDRQAVEQALNALEDHYQQLKARLLEIGAGGELPVAEMEARLRVASMMRRAIEQAVKAALMLDGAPDATARRE